MTLDDYLRLLQTADDTINQDAARLLTETTDAIMQYTQSIMHRQTGNMADTTYRLGPFPVGVGAIETTIQSGAWYAGDEAGRGGDHDWVTRTLTETTALQQQLADALAERVAQLLTGNS